MGEAPRPWTTRFLLLTAVGVGLATGLAEAAFMIKQVYLRSVFVMAGRDSLWIAPAAEGLFFLLAGLVLLLLGRAFPRIRDPHVWVGILAGLSAYSFLVFYDRLHPVSNLLLAMGTGAAVAHLVRRWPGATRRTLRWASLAMIALVPLLAAGLHAGLAARERAVLRDLPAAPRNAPNVLLLVLDTVRARNLSLYGHDRPTTPQLERLAARGVRFDLAVASSSWTLPSHASMFTGRHPHEHGADWRIPLDATYPTLAEFLSERGWRTAGFVANAGYAGWETGLNRGFAHYEDYEVSPGVFLANSTLVRRITVASTRLRSWVGTDELLARKSAAEVNAAFLRWVADGDDRRFFAFLNYFDAHAPYMPPDSHARRFSRGEPRGSLSPLFRHERFDHAKPTAEERRLEEEAYDAAIASLDAEIGELLDALEAAGVLGNTVVIVTSDHGEEFGEHGTFGHGDDLYLVGLHVPLVVVDPRGLDAPAVVEQTVSLNGLPAAVAALLGYEESPFPVGVLSEALGVGPPVPAAARRALSELSDDPRLPDWVPAARGDMVSVVADSVHYIRNGDGREEVYDLERDPQERRNIAAAVRGAFLARWPEIRRSMAGS